MFEPFKHLSSFASSSSIGSGASLNDFGSKASSGGAPEDARASFVDAWAGAEVLYGAWDAAPGASAFVASAAAAGVSFIASSG